MDKEFNLDEFLSEPIEEKKYKIENQIQKKKKINLSKLLLLKKVTLFGLLIVLLVFSVSSYRTLYGGEWICIAKECTDWLSGDDWVVENCRPQNNTLICNVDLPDGTEANIPLVYINTSLVKSCKTFSCTAEIYVKAIEEIKTK